jgi:hypothetical protein
VGTSKGWYKDLLFVIGLVGTIEYASYNKPSYIFFHSSLIHIHLEVGNYIPTTKMSYKCGGVSLSDKMQHFTFRSIKFIKLVEKAILEMLVILTITLFYTNLAM